MKEAPYYAGMDDGRVRRETRPHPRIIALGKRGICRARVKRYGLHYSEIYNRKMAKGMDPHIARIHTSREGWK